MSAWMNSAWVCCVLASGGRGTGESAVPPAAPAGSESIVLKAAKVHLGDGTVESPGVVVIKDGKVVAAGKDPGLPLGSKVIDLKDCEITPGLVDAACQLGPSAVMGWAEQSSEIIPQYDLRDAIDLCSPDLQALAREGVTTVYLTPEAASVIGGKGVAFKTAGSRQRWLGAAPAIKANLGNEASSRGGFNTTPFGAAVTFYARRPTTRMGSAWVFRKAFYDAIAFRDGLPAGDDPAALQVLVEVLDGKTGMRIQAREAHDIYIADRLASEFGLTFTVEYGIEAFECLDFLKQRNIPVIFGPIDSSNSFVQASADDPNLCLTTPARLHEMGIEFCLTACDLTGESGLAHQAGLAIRFGLPAAEALRAVTSAPARMLGVSDRVGMLSANFDADLVAWNGAPLCDTSRISLVLIDGKVVLDRDGLWQ